MNFFRFNFPSYLTMEPFYLEQEKHFTIPKGSAMHNFGNNVLKYIPMYFHVEHN